VHEVSRAGSGYALHFSLSMSKSFSMEQALRRKFWMRVIRSQPHLRHDKLC
jgi:hypothetical protein